MTAHVEDIKKTPLHALHVALKARMAPFAGYDLPIQYPVGILKEHQHVRAQAGLFDVSHMGQVRLRGQDPAAVLERLVPGDIQNLERMRIRYTVFTNERGGVLDDLMVTHVGAHELFLVVNAACKDADIAHMRRAFGDLLEIEVLENRALLALQGPMAAQVLGRLIPESRTMPFMSYASAVLQGIPVILTRSGYTGEDGFEISIAAKDAEEVAEIFLKEAEVAPIGLGARDSLRLEAGLCLYGHDLDQDTTPVEAGLSWVIGGRRRVSGDFPGAAVILYQLEHGAPRRRVGLRLEGRQPAREGVVITDVDGVAVGKITSGGFGPSVNAPVAMGYVDAAFAAPGTPVLLEVRGKALPAKVVKMPFAPHRYYRG
ncbi:aminomethyltransferase [Azospirillaceae bacterium]